jgi:DNA-binding MarR family transcriptional regulator
MADRAKLRLARRSSTPMADPGARTTRPRPAEDLPEFDRTIHERIRLGILSALAINESLSFNDLRRLLKTTDGNLSVHARKLEDAHYVTCSKFFEGRIPRSEYRLTPAGKRALEKYIEQMEDLIRRTRKN